MTWSHLLTVWTFIGPVFGFVIGIGTKWLSFKIREKFDIRKADVALVERMVRSGGEITVGDSISQFTWLEQCRDEALLIRGKRLRRLVGDALQVSNFEIHELRKKLRSFYD